MSEVDVASAELRPLVGVGGRERVLTLEGLVAVIVGKARREVGSETGLAIPITVVHKTIDDDDFIDNYTCSNVPPGLLE